MYAGVGEGGWWGDNYCCLIIIIVYCVYISMDVLEQDCVVRSECDIISVLNHHSRWLLTQNNQAILSSQGSAKPENRKLAY